MLFRSPEAIAESAECDVDVIAEAVIETVKKEPQKLIEGRNEAITDNAKKIEPLKITTKKRT